MNYNDLKYLDFRKEIESALCGLMNFTFRRTVEYEHEILNLIDKAITKVDKIFNNYSEEEINKVLGGELNTVIYRSEPLDEEKYGMPLFMELDLIRISLEENFLLESNHRDRIIKILTHIEELREKAAKLKYDKKFEPDQEYNEFFKDDLVGSKGNIEFVPNYDSGVLQVAFTYINERVDYHGGDYIPISTSYSTSKPMILYQRDYEIECDKRQKIYDEKYDRFYNIVGKYFKDKKLLRYTGRFHRNLVDEDMDPTLRTILFGICYDLEEYFQKNKFILDKPPIEFFNEVEYKIEELIKRENALKQQKQERELVINNAKERYNSKNFFWKFVNKKINPEVQNFDEMSTEEINSLYGGNKK